MKRVVIVHGYRGRADRGWLKRLGDTLREHGVEVIAPAMPDSERPDMDEWLRRLTETVGQPDADTVFVAHSLGCAVTLRYLDSCQVEAVGGLVLVAGFYESNDSPRSRWFGPEPDWSKLKQAVRHRVCIFSDDDKLVEPRRSRQLAKALEAEGVELPGRGHFNNFEERDLLEAEAAVLSCFGIKL